jgi:hypothetical protein
MSKHGLHARPVYHHKRDSIEAHLTIMSAALAVGRWIEDQTGWSIRKRPHRPSLPEQRSAVSYPADELVPGRTGRNR